MRGVFAVLMFVAAAGCVAPERVDTVPQTMAFSQVDAEEAKIDELTALIAALGPDVDPAEAALVARIAVEDPLIWAKEWGVEDAPYIHNIKVNQGKKPRGLCKDWADDLQVRLAREGVQTLDWHRAIANHDNILVEHSTLIVSAKGDGMAEGVVLDPWRLGQGQLFFTKVKQDRKYRWVERSEVFAYKRKRREMRNNTDS